MKFHKKILRSVTLFALSMLLMLSNLPVTSAQVKDPTDAEIEATYFFGFPEQTRRKTVVKGILLVNKWNPLPAKYKPKLATIEGKEGDVQAVQALRKLIAGAKKDAGYNFRVVSGYRSYEYQKNLYDGYKAENGADRADMFSARPGFSEHQSGLAFDVLAGSTQELVKAFGNTHEGQWLANNAHKYGFIIRYPKGKENKTKYQYEPWHIRYIGTEHSEKMWETNHNLSLEEYLNAVERTVFDLMDDEPGFSPALGERTDGKEGGVDASDENGILTDGGAGNAGGSGTGGGADGGGSTGGKRDPFEPFRDHKVNNSIVGLDTGQNVLPGETSYTFLVTAEKTYKFLQKVMMFMCAGLILFVSLQGVALVLTTSGDVKYTKFLDKSGKMLFGAEGYGLSTREIGVIIVKNFILLIVMMVVVMCSFYVAIQGKIYAGLAYILSFIM